MFLDRPQDSSVLANVEVLFENILRCCLKADEMSSGKKEKSPIEPLMESICLVVRVDRSLCQVVGVDLDDDSYFLNLVKMYMITGARLSWWVIGLAKYPPALTGSSISLASEQALALWRWKSLKISKPL